MNHNTTFENKRIWVVGHRGLVGSAIVRRLERESCQVLVVDRKTLDLRRQFETETWVAKNKPDLIFLAAATVGGIYANDVRPAEFIYDNLAIETNIIHAAWKQGVRKLLFLGSSCVYPKLAEQPLLEQSLLTGPLEPTNEWYAIAKIAGIKLCQAYRRQYGCDFISAMPTNLYGPYDNFHPDYSHVIPGILRRMHEGKLDHKSSLPIWGSGKQRREFLYVDDLADALIYVMKHYSNEEPINIGVGQDITIQELAELMAEVVQYQGRLDYDISKPDGTPQKLLNVDKLNQLGWKAKIALKEGLELTYQWFMKNAIEGQVR